MTDKYETILLFGPPGIGKGTQGARLGSLDGYFHFSTGDMFRGLDTSTPIGEKVKGFLDRRELVPDEVTMELFQATIQQRVESGQFNPEKQFLLLDGLPRNASQVGLVNEVVDVKQIVYLTVDDTSILVKRIQQRAIDQGRADDQKPEVVQRGIDVYMEQTTKVLEHYSEDITLKVDGSKTIDEVYEVVSQKVVAKN